MSKPEQSNFFTVNKGEVSKGYTVLTPAEERELLERKNQKIEVRQENHQGTSPEKAAEIMEANFLGSDAVEEALGVKLTAEEIPPINFTEEELKRARELGQILILRVSQALDGSPLTMQKMNEQIQPKLTQMNLGKALFVIDWYKKDHFYTTEVAEKCWALVSEEIIPDSTNKNYLEQTEIIATYIKDSVFKDMTIPPEFADAIDEFEKQKADIASIINIDWEEAAKRLSKLKLNKLARQTAIETLYDINVRLLIKGNRLLEKICTWTNSCDSDGKFVLVGGADYDGAYVRPDGPGHQDRNIGVSLSRKSLNL